MTDTVKIAAAVKGPIGKLGGGFMISREAMAFGTEIGIEGMAPYFRGRFGVLGEVDADVVTAAAGFFPPAAIRAAWELTSGVPAATAVEGYTRACHAFARRKMSGISGADRLADLLGRVVESADVRCAPVFAGWRAVPLPDDALLRTAQLAHVLRELRGGVHVAAVLAGGLTPLEAILAGSSDFLEAGAGNARFFGWPEPYAEPTEEVRRRRAAAEELTDVLVAPAFAVLDATEAEELVTLLTEAERTVFG
ncbi:hypothetical protein DPM19_27170 [Actinomadura craniellae]|uniref:EvbL n=1 Tax=Actinomadura craniellae TaxID=2231787 RepID=A0A365GYZ2_9ACTN|nr:hypothetical protein [Actinomadura craniellae]RAY12031.1 hypothetical protein DPM19_27170 [Actinomadura craniellae]